MKIVITFVILAASAPTLGSCGWEESICMDNEVVVHHAATDPGGGCEKRTATDPECPEGEILRRIEKTGREDCIRNLVGHEKDGLEHRRSPE